jgi:hypothetical protein
VLAFVDAPDKTSAIEEAIRKFIVLRPAFGGHFSGHSAPKTLPDMLCSLPALSTAKARALRRRSFPRSRPSPARDVVTALLALGAPRCRLLDPPVGNSGRDLLALAQFAFAFGRTAAQTLRDELALATRTRNQKAIATRLHGTAIEPCVGDTRFLLLKRRHTSVEAIAALRGAEATITGNVGAPAR